MPTAEEFDEFYVSTRRGLVLQTFALTGDLVAARSAVRDAYVAARHHWEKVGRQGDPEAWVRPRAWSAAQRRHTARPWHRERHVTPEQATTLEALHQLSDAQRRAVVLTTLTDLSLPEIARELSLPVAKVDTLLEAGLTEVATALGCAREEIPGHLEALGSAADTVKLPRASVIRRNGLRRRRNHMVVGSVLIAATTISAGAFVAVSTPAPPPPRVGALVSKKMLLTDAQVTGLDPKQAWATVSTTDNTQGSGLNHRCQTSRFADPRGLGTWVRTFQTGGSNPRRLVQTVEISNSPGAARSAYATTLGWYAGCTAPRLQLIDAYALSGVGDQSQILRLRIPDRQDRSFVVGIARSGALTISTVLATATPQPASAALLADTLSTAVRDLCTSKVAGACVGALRIARTLPPRSGEAPGMLAIADLPAIGRVDQPWVGVDPQIATTNLAATTCDNADFVKSGATKPLTRSYLFPPSAKVPKRFGVTETIGRFATPRAAARFSNQIIARMKACPDRKLSSTVSQQLVHDGGGTSYALWRLENQVNVNEDEVMFWMGIARVGSYVAQVTLTPVKQYDVRRDTFTGLVIRARDRLFEVSRS